MCIKDYLTAKTDSWPERKKIRVQKDAKAPWEMQTYLLFLLVPPHPPLTPSPLGWSLTVDNDSKCDCNT